MMPVEALPVLPEPAELWMPKIGVPERFRVIRYEVGQLETRARWLVGEPLVIRRGVRLHVDPKTKPLWPHYWTIIQRRAVPQVLKHLQMGIPPGMELEILPIDPPPRTHFQVRWVPIEEE